MIIRVFEEVRKYPNPTVSPGEEPTITERLVHEVRSESKKVQAGVLRALADELDPPSDGKAYR